MSERTVTCACGAVLKESYPAAINRHTATQKHQAWLEHRLNVRDEIEPDLEERSRLPYDGRDGSIEISQSDEDAMIEEQDQLMAEARGVATCDVCGLTDDHKHDPETPTYPWESEPAQRNDESASAYLSRLESSLTANEYTSFIGSDEGQKVLAQAQIEDKDARKAARKAADTERRETIARGEATEKEARKPAAVTKGLHIDKETGATVFTPPVGSKVLVDGKQVGVVSDGPLPADAHLPLGKPLNKPLKLGTEPIDVNGVMVYPILHRDGSIAGHQSDHYIWKCPTCGKRLRSKTCLGGNAKGARPDLEHAPTIAPQGYRFDDRVVK